jgi:hypothetical protein
MQSKFVRGPQPPSIVLLKVGHSVTDPLVPRIHIIEPIHTLACVRSLITPPTRGVQSWVHTHTHLAYLHMQLVT